MADKLLIADDEPDIVDTLARCFASRGYEIMRASSGEEAVRQAGRAPDLILLDVNMPDLDGLEVCRRIRQHVACPIIFLTARVEESDKLRGFAAGGDDYVVKPFSLDELAARVDAHLRRERRHGSASELRFDGELVVNYTDRKRHLGRARAGPRAARIRHSGVPLAEPRHGVRPRAHLRVRLGHRRRGRLQRNLRARPAHPRQTRRRRLREAVH